MELQRVQDHENLYRDPHSKAVLVSGDAVSAYRRQRAVQRSKDDLIHQMAKRLAALEERVKSLEAERNGG